MARAVRDHLADCLSTLPNLLEEGNIPSLHFYFANLGGMRKLIFPSLVAAYGQWLATDDCTVLQTVSARGKAHWLEVGRAMLDLHEHHGKDCIGHIEKLVEGCYL